VGGVQAWRARCGRPAALRAGLIDRGHLSSVAEAFDRYLAKGRPAYVDATGSILRKASE
jgi:predicted metal-dependent phosphoesterase TrpH